MQQVCNAECPPMSQNETFYGDTKKIKTRPARARQRRYRMLILRILKKTGLLAHRSQRHYRMLLVFDQRSLKNTGDWGPSRRTAGPIR